MIVLPIGVSLATTIAAELLGKPWLDWRRDRRVKALTARDELQRSAMQLWVQLVGLKAGAEGVVKSLTEHEIRLVRDPHMSGSDEAVALAAELDAAAARAEPLMPEVVRKVARMSRYHTEQFPRMVRDKRMQHAIGNAELAIKATNLLRSWAEARGPQRPVYRWKAHRVIELGAQHVGAEEDAASSLHEAA